MSADLRAQLQHNLGAAYSLDRELGGGGMSRVFVAHEVALGRNVVIKVLSPELAAGVNVDRFKREIQLAAQLQHPHIVPLLSAGVIDDLPYYTMPYVEGETLRARLSRSGEFPVAEGIRILREITDALDCAHTQGVVHRDIKPENILLSRQHALVADFGVAKALSSAVRSGGTLTDIGIALGTPAYMAPEQAAAEPNVDHRADIYALGVVAYEMFAGRAPFAGRSPQALLTAQMVERPVDIAALRSAVPPMLAALIMRCLEKHPADRPQSAADLLLELETVSTPGTGSRAAMPAATSDPGSPGTFTVVALYLLAFTAVVGAAFGARELLAVPGWIVPGAVIVMLLGLPVILATALARAKPVPLAALSPSPRSSVERLAHFATPWLTWRRTVLGGVGAVLLLTLSILGYMGSRALGIGPAGSLFGAGMMKERDKVIVAEFGHTGADTSLGEVVSSAFRTDLGQSSVISIAQSSEVAAVLQRMQRPPDTRLTPAVAREVAQREGYKVVVEGEVAQVASSYVLTARLVSAGTGEVLAPFRVTASTSEDIIPAIDRLTREVRRRIGESLKEIRETPPLWKVTTSSIEALRKYVQAGAALDHGSDYTRGFALLDEAIALDTNFAAAYISYATLLFNRQLRPLVAERMNEKAYQLRDRLTDAERYQAVGEYFGPTGSHYDAQRAIAAYRSLADLDSSKSWSYNQLGQVYRFQRDLPRAASYYAHALERDSSSTVIYSNLGAMLFGMGRTRDATAMFKRLADRFPDDPVVLRRLADYAFARFLLDSAEIYGRRIVAVRPGDPIFSRESNQVLIGLATIRGKLAERERLIGVLVQNAEASRSDGEAFAVRLALAHLESWFRHDRKRALDRIHDALSHFPPDSLGRLRSGTLNLATQYALAGRPDLAREAMNSNRSLIDTTTDHRVIRQIEATRGDIAMAENRPADAILHYRQADAGSCTICFLPPIARAYDLAGQPDSALAMYERYVTTQYTGAVQPYSIDLPEALRRLGELFEARGDMSNAAKYYTRFVELWADADPELRPRVEEARRRLDVIRRRAG